VAYTLTECGPVYFSRAVEHLAGHVVHTIYHVKTLKQNARDAKKVGVSRSTDFNNTRKHWESNGNS
jgi:hypothetical protein